MRTELRRERNRLKSERIRRRWSARLSRLVARDNSGGTWLGIDVELEPGGVNGTGGGAECRGEEDQES